MYECDFACKNFFMWTDNTLILYLILQLTKSFINTYQNYNFILPAGQTSAVITHQQWWWWQQQRFELVIPSEPNNVCICGEDIMCIHCKTSQFLNLSPVCNRTQVPFFLSEPQCVTSLECSEYCSHPIPLHAAFGLTSSLYSGYGPALEERRMESDGKIRTTASPISLRERV